ncbi:hypothetical protein PR003_g25796 [Phytophthora rubi]|uniref:Uncharacterized protein n=1 Tax=Phytophthora rubi TaxID=129364 RepID=A0A6A3HU74_9STRA|nr:hypothetical protein PR002_g26881 [Phytophthora rubi]KAE8980265.1 hypothetical protein PR001_g24321 [Phytophthora rubi]KAE9288485.1 hypothetical protein PR003_g25796 [Phytophthora rubi]
METWRIKMQGTCLLTRLGVLLRNIYLKASRTIPRYCRRHPRFTFCRFNEVVLPLALWSTGSRPTLCTYQVPVVVVERSGDECFRGGLATLLEIRILRCRAGGGAHFEYLASLCSRTARRVAKSHDGRPLVDHVLVIDLTSE